MTLRFSLRTFAVVLTLLPLGLAGVMAGRPLATSAVYTLNWILLCLSLVAALVVRGPQRSFWIGFTVFSWCYWMMASERLMTTAAPPASSYGPWTVNREVRQFDATKLLSTVLIDFFESQAGPRWNIGDAVMAQYRGGSYYPGVVDAIRPGEYFIRWTDGSSSPSQWTPAAQVQPGTSSARIAADCFVCSLWGLVGGLAAGVLFRGPVARKAESVEFIDGPGPSAPPADAVQQTTEEL